MNRIHTLFRRHGDHPIDFQVRLHRSFAFADQIRLIGLEAMQAQPVFLRKDSHRTQSQFVGRSEDADGDFPAIQCQQFPHV